MIQKILKVAVLTLGVIATTGILGCAEQPSAEEPCNFVTNNANRRVSWARTPIEMYADSNFTDGEIVQIEEAMKVWNDQFKADVFVLKGKAQPGQLPQPKLSADGRVISDGYNGIYRANESIFEKSAAKDEQARTSISFRGDFIYEADILVDDSEIFFYDDHKIAASEGEISFKSLLVHELGHVLGLEHIEEAGHSLSEKSDKKVLVPSVMNPKLQNGEYRVDITDKDFESLACEYQ